MPMMNWIRDYEELLDRLHFLSNKGSFRNKFKYSAYFMLSMFVPIMLVVMVIVSAYVTFN